MICGSATPVFFYGFMCEETHFYQYLYLLTVWFFCLLATANTLYNRYDLTKQWVNAIVYSIAGLSGAPGLIHLTWYIDDRHLKSFAGWAWFLSGFLYIIGAIVYGVKFPERYFPRTFDIWLQAHTIFHILVVVAALIQFWSAIRIFHER